MIPSGIHFGCLGDDAICGGGCETGCDCTHDAILCAWRRDSDWPAVMGFGTGAASDFDKLGDLGESLDDSSWLCVGSAFCECGSCC